MYIDDLKAIVSKLNDGKIDELIENYSLFNLYGNLLYDLHQLGGIPNYIRFAGHWSDVLSVEGYNVDNAFINDHKQEITTLLSQIEKSLTSEDVADKIIKREPSWAIYFKVPSLRKSNHIKNIFLNLSGLMRPEDLHKALDEFDTRNNPNFWLDLPEQYYSNPYVMDEFRQSSLYNPSFFFELAKKYGLEWIGLYNLECEFTIEQLKEILNHSPYSLFNINSYKNWEKALDEQTLKTALSKIVKAQKYVQLPDFIKDNKDVIIICIVVNSEFAEQIPDKLYQDKDFITALMNKCPQCIKHLNAKLLIENESVDLATVKSILASNPESVLNIDITKIKNKNTSKLVKQTLLNLVRDNKDIITDINKNYFKDPEFLMDLKDALVDNFGL